MNIMSVVRVLNWGVYLGKSCIDTHSPPDGRISLSALEYKCVGVATSQLKNVHNVHAPSVHIYLQYIWHIEL